MTKIQNPKYKNSGFTLIELLVTVSIILFLTAFVMLNWKEGDKRFSLQRSSHRLAQDLRMVQEFAMSSKEFSGAGPSFKGSYGIRFETGSSSYILFADLDNNQAYDPGEELEEFLGLEKGVKTSNLSPSSPLTILFLPPDPTVIINPDASSAVVTVANNGQSKSIRINKAGLISID